MALPEVIRRFKDQQKALNQLVKQLETVSKLDTDQEKNLPKIKEALKKIDESGSSVARGEEASALNQWLTDYGAQLSRVESQVSQTIGSELDRLLQNEGFRLTGHVPDLKAGLFTIEVDVDKWQATIWYGPKEERLERCSLAPKEIVATLNNANKNIGGPLDEEAFRAQLNEAYKRQRSILREEDIPINAMLTEMAFLIQSNRFQQEPTQANFKSYSRADFSYDLFRHLSPSHQASTGPSFSLSVATRAHTGSRKTYLWVPENESGQGSTYSHIKARG